MTEHLRNGATATEDIERETMRKVIWRILPFLIVSYLVSNYRSREYRHGFAADE